MKFCGKELNSNWQIIQLNMLEYFGLQLNVVKDTSRSKSKLKFISKFSLRYIEIHVIFKVEMNSNWQINQSKIERISWDSMKILNTISFFKNLLIFTSEPNLEFKKFKNFILKKLTCKSIKNWESTLEFLVSLNITFKNFSKINLNSEVNAT